MLFRSVWPLFTGVCLVGFGGVQISAAGTTHVIGIAPGAVADTFSARIANAYIAHGESGQDGILLDNTGMGKKLHLTMKRVGGDGDGDMIATVHADADNAIRIYWDGDDGNDVGSAVNFTGGNDGDRLYIRRCELSGGLNFSDTAVALACQLKHCTVLKEGVLNGNAAQTILAVGCYSIDGSSGAFAAFAAGDVTGAIVDTIVA